MRSPIPFPPITPLTAALCCLTACADRTDQDTSDGVVALWMLSEPTLEIGVVEGDPNYELHQAISSVRLPDGRIVVSNAGSQEIRFYDSDGQFLAKAGGRGGGPGEFRWLSRVYRYGADSIMALDNGANRLSVFDTDGNYARLAAAVSITGDTIFPLDVWLHGQFWVDGALEPELRGTVKRVLSRLTVSDTGLAYRFVRVGDGGELWIREPLAVNADSYHWTVIDSTGSAIAVIQTPLRFDPHHIGRGFVMGRWRDENDVNYIRLHTVLASDEAIRPPAWITASSEGGPQLSPEEEAQLIEALRKALVQVVMAQESHFANNMSYTENRHLLTWTPPEGVGIDIIEAGRTGWVAVATDQRLSRICGMAVGLGTPPGWTEGMAVCS